MASTDRAILKDVTIEVSDGDTTPTDLAICFTNISHTANKTYADATASCDAGKVFIPSDIIEDTMSFTFPWEGDANTGHARLWTLSRGVTLGAFTVTLPDGATLTFNAYVKVDLFQNGQYDGVMQASAELKISDGIVYTANPA